MAHLHSPALLSIGREVLAELRDELDGQCRLVRMQLLASRFYEAVKAEAATTSPHDKQRLAQLTATLDHCRRVTQSGATPPFVLAAVRAAIAAATAPALRIPEHRTPLRVIEGGRAA
jgi:hypothetical protein